MQGKKYIAAALVCGFILGSSTAPAQVSGPHAQVEKCKAALLIEASFFGSFRAKALIPIDKVDITDVNRVQGVGVSAQIDVKL